MTLSQRALVGAALGAFLTLFASPASRPFFATGFRKVPAGGYSNVADASNTYASHTRTMAEASYWVQVACERIRTHHPLAKEEIASLLALSEQCGHREPDNAIWPQFRAILLAQKGDLTGSRHAWEVASRRQSWNDHQTERLLQARRNIAGLTGANLSWQLGYVYFLRSDAVADVVKSYGQSLLRLAGSDDEASLRLRYITMLNAALLRNGSRALKVGYFGANLVELSTYPSDLSDTASPRRIWLAQTRLTSRMRAYGLTEEAAKAEKALRNNDAWRYLPQRLSPDDNVRELCLAAIAADSLPGIFALVGLVGWGVYGLGLLFKSPFERIRIFHAAAVAVFGLAAVVAVFLSTRTLIAAGSCGLSAIFLATGPFRPRHRKTNDMGPLFSFVMVSLAATCLLCFSLAMMADTTASRALYENLGPNGEYLLDGSTFLAVGLVVSFLICLAAPGWAVVHRYGTPDLLALSIRSFGIKLGIAGLALSIVSGPIAIGLDQRLSAQLQNIVENEPGYYFAQ